MRRVRCDLDRWTRSKDNTQNIKETTSMIAWFHQWGVNYEEFETGPGNFSVAIVEDAHGKVHTFPADRITFLDKE